MVLKRKIFDVSFELSIVPSYIENYINHVINLILLSFTGFLVISYVCCLIASISFCETATFGQNINIYCQGFFIYLFYYYYFFNCSWRRRIPCIEEASKPTVGVSEILLSESKAVRVLSNVLRGDLVTSWCGHLLFCRLLQHIQREHVNMLHTFLIRYLCFRLKKYNN